MAHSAFQHADELFVAAGLAHQMPAPWRRKLATRWVEFCWYLSRTPLSLCADPDHDTLVRTVLQEFVGLCLRVPGGQRTFPLAILLSECPDDGVLSPRLEALLPDVVHPEIPAVKALLAQWAQEAQEQENERIRLAPSNY